MSEDKARFLIAIVGIISVAVGLLAGALASTDDLCQPAVDRGCAEWRATQAGKVEFHWTCGEETNEDE